MVPQKWELPCQKCSDVIVNGIIFAVIEKKEVTGIAALCKWHAKKLEKMTVKELMESVERAIEERKSGGENRGKDGKLPSN